MSIAVHILHILLSVIVDSILIYGVCIVTVLLDLLWPVTSISLLRKLTLQVETRKYTALQQITCFY